MNLPWAPLLEFSCVVFGQGGSVTVEVSATVSSARPIQNCNASPFS